MVFSLIRLCGAPFGIGLKQLFVIISTSVGVLFFVLFLFVFFLFHRFDCKMIKYPDPIFPTPWVMHLIL